MKIVLLPKVTTAALHSLFCVALVGLAATATANAQANSEVVFEGRVSYQTSGTTSNVRTTGAVSRLANYSFSSTFDQTQIRLVFSPQPYTPGRNLGGYTVATSGVIAAFEPRTYYSNISIQGQTRLPRGKRFSAVLIAVDAESRILAAHNFTKRVTTRSATRALSSKLVTLRKKSPSHERFVELR